MRRTRCHKYLQLLLICCFIQGATVSGEEAVDAKKLPESHKIDEKPADIEATGEKPNHEEHASQHFAIQKVLLGHDKNIGKSNHEKDALLHFSLHKAALEHGNNMAKMHSANSTTKTPESKTENGSQNGTILLGAPENSTKVNKVDETAKVNISKATDDTKVGGVAILPHVIPGTRAEIAKDNNTMDTENGTNPEKCTPPAIKQFPHPLMSPTARRHGGLIVHIIVAMYMFLGLAIVCDEYFVASLDRICEELKMAPDVAGATFMAAGSSAPELATVIIGVFFAKDDIGISGVIGSAVFNIMFVISCCGLCSAAVVYLNWWPLIRDCFFYAISILVMLVVISNEEISWYESLFMLFVYVLYCIVLHFNTPLEKWAQTWPVPFKTVQPNEQSGLVSYKTLEEHGKHPNYGMEWSPDKPPENVDQGMKNFGMEWSPEKHQQNFANQLSGPALNQATIDVSPNPPPPPRPNQQEYYKPKEYDPSKQVNPLVRPEGGLYAHIVWVVVYPIHWFCRKTMPDCRSERFRNWYPFTFFVSMVWISFYSYFMVWMITIIGYTLGIPDTVMGLTFVAAGVSVPDALSSIAVIKEGYGDMAVSNAVGSNVFDILICLGLPWFIKTAIVRPGTTVRVISKGLTYSTLSLLSTVVFLVVATHLNGWKLDRRYGIVLMVWYLIFITIASLYELNFFGYMNPPECSTDW